MAIIVRENKAPYRKMLAKREFRKRLYLGPYMTFIRKKLSEELEKMGIDPGKDIVITASYYVTHSLQRRNYLESNKV